MQEQKKNVQLKEKLRRARRAKGLTQERLAEELGTSAFNIYRWESGKVQPGAYFSAKLCEVLGKNAEELGLLPEIDGNTAANTQATARAFLWNVPYSRNPFFTGRDDILNTVHETLNHEHPLVITQPWALHGLGGIGKTQIALEYAYRYRQEYPFVFWLNAASRDSLSAGYVEIANLLQLAEKDDPDRHRVHVAVKQWLVKHQDWLLVMDNADDVAIIQEFMPLECSGHLLLTSRAQAWGALAQGVRVEDMGMAEGILFLLRRAKIIAPDMSIDRVPEESFTAAEAIVIEMAFLPLALDQAGAYIDEVGCSLSAYLHLYQRRHQELLKRRGQMPLNYPESVATTWSLSFQKVEQVNPTAADILRFCAFLEPDTIPEELLNTESVYFHAVAPSFGNDPIIINMAIEELRKFSLIYRNPHQKTLSIHRMVQVVVKDIMSRELQQQWAKAAIDVTHIVFPTASEPETWSQCLHYLPQAQACANLIQEYTLDNRESLSLLMRTASYLKSQALYDQSEQVYQQALSICQQLSGETHLETANVLVELAELSQMQGAYAEAESLYQQSLRIYEETLGGDHLEIASALHGLAKTYGLQGKYAQMEDLHKRALHIREHVLGAAHPEVADSLNLLAILYHYQQRFVEAETLYLRALAIREHALGAENIGIPALLNNLADLYRDQGKFAEAEPLYLRALSIRKQILRPDHPEIAHLLNGLGKLYRAQGKYAQAEPIYYETLHMRERTLGPEHPYVAHTLHGLANAYKEQKKFAEAEPLYQQALAIWEHALGPEHPDVAHPLFGLGDVYAEQGKYEEAEPFYQRALTIWEQALGPDDTYVAGALYGLGNVYRERGAYDEAESLYRRSQDIYERALGAAHPELAFPLHNLAILFQRQGKFAQAELLYEQAIAIRVHALERNHPDLLQIQQDFALFQQMKSDLHTKLPNQ